MDVFARAFEIAHDILENSPIPGMVADRYASFDSGDGARFEKGEMTLEQLASLAGSLGEPERKSGQQELYELILNQYLR
jgi:xylose isomerase